MTEADDDSIRLGASIRAARKNAKIGLRSFAAKLSVSPATLSAMENGKSGVSALRLFEIARLLGQPLTVFMQSGNAGTVAKPAAPEPSPMPWRAFAPLPFDRPLFAALDAFTEFGYHGSNMRDIADRAGLSGPGIYHYYPSKQDMLIAIVDYTLNDLHLRFERARDEGRDAAERFTLLVECNTLFHAYRSKLGFIVGSELRSLPTEAREQSTKLRARLRSMHDAEAEQATQDGAFACAHPRDASRAVLTMCSALPQWYRIGDKLSPEQVAKMYVDFARGLMRAKKPASSASRRRR